ncbi:ubiquitin carrier protein 1 [Actinidia rufa]|uniref:Ubiquitin carrier protein 1 n=1 Tax=Actinidia rufa TaxID=165716 RepID=A0A7J0F5L1_9ERIC|nr:ubiquitin carrier protein 1 [Actinidia rufa]
MSTPARKRLMRDFKRLQQDPPAGLMTLLGTESMRMGVYVWIFYRTSGALFMMLQQYSHLSSHCFVIQTQIPLQILKQLVCSVKISGSTTEECEKLWSRAGQQTEKPFKSTSSFYCARKQ